jgi:uncharacterized protein
MLIGVVSDTHNNYPMVSKALGRLAQRGVSQILHCGDIEDEETVALFSGFDTHFVFGNCDSDQNGLRRAMTRSGATLHENFGSLELEGMHIAWIHGDNGRLRRELEASGHYDFLFYGHTHRPEAHRAGLTWVINPGALHRAKPKTFLILDLSSKKWESVEIDGESR